MNPQDNNMAILGQIVKFISPKLIEKLKNKYKVQTRVFSAKKSCCSNALCSIKSCTKFK